MGPSGTGCGPKRERLRATAVCTALLLLAAFAGPAGAQPVSSKPDSARGGSVIRYEESPGSNILYHEARGGMVSAVPPPVARAPAAPPKAKGNGAAEAPAERAPPAESRKTRVAARDRGAKP